MTLFQLGLGGLLRDFSGSFLFGFYDNVGRTSVLHAEIMGVLHGLCLCWERGFKSIMCYSNSLLAVNLIHDGVPPFHPLANEILRVRKYLELP